MLSSFCFTNTHTHTRHLVWVENFRFVLLCVVLSCDGNKRRGYLINFYSGGFSIYWMSGGLCRLLLDGMKKKNNKTFEIYDEE